jgi:hypothetical protein
VETISHAAACSLHWLWQHKACISLGGIATLVGLYGTITSYLHRKIDGKIMRVLRLSIPLTSDEISANIGGTPAKTESRLWDLLDRDKIRLDQTSVDGKTRWGMPLNGSRGHARD